MRIHHIFKADGQPYICGDWKKKSDLRIHRWDNNAGCPYFEGVINNRDISIHLIYEDSIPHTGGNSGSGGVTNPEDKPTEDINPSLILILYYAYTSGCYNNEYDLVFKIHSGLYTPEGIDMNPMYGEPFSITYAFAGQTSKTASLIPKSDHYILKVKVDPTLKDKTLFILFTCLVPYHKDYIT